MLCHLAAKRLLLEVVEPCCTLDIRQCFCRGDLQPFVDLPADQRPFELADKFFQMMFYHPIQIYQFTIDIVNDFELTGVLRK